MERWKLALAAASAALIAAALLALYFLPRPSPAPPGSFERCPDAAVVYVYATEEQRKAADAVVADLKTMLQYSGVNVVNLPLCTVPASAFRQRFQVYPAILLRGNVSIPGSYVSEVVDGLRLLYPLIPAMIAQQRGVPLTYSYEGEVIVVESTAPLANPSLSSLEQARKVLSVVFLVNVTRLTSTRDPQLASRLSMLPALLVKSGYNLTRGAPYIVEVAPGYYTVAEKYQASLLHYFGVFAYELRRNPLSGLRGGVALGASGAPTLYVLEDYHCPFCAKFVNSSADLLLELARQGRLRVIFLDLIVHSESAPMHAFARCLFNATGDAELYLELTRELYRLFLQGRQTTLDDAVAFAKARVPGPLLNETLSCSKAAESKVLAESQELQRLGFTGTPTFIFWSDSSGRGLLIEGCLDVNTCLRSEDFSRILEWLAGQG